MTVLIVYGSKRQGTEGIAATLATALRERGLEADVRAAGRAGGINGYQAVIVGGALYAGKWHRDSLRFLKRNDRMLRERPVWLFSSGPLNDSALEADIPPVPKVQDAMTRIGARGHVTFGGRLTPDAKGFIAAKMAKNKAGDWRDEEQIRSWAGRIAGELSARAG